MKNEDDPKIKTNHKRKMVQNIKTTPTRGIQNYSLHLKINDNLTVLKILNYFMKY